MIAACPTLSLPVYSSSAVYKLELASRRPKKKPGLETQIIQTQTHHSGAKSVLRTWLSTQRVMRGGSRSLQGHGYQRPLSRTCCKKPQEATFVMRKTGTRYFRERIPCLKTRYFHKESHTSATNARSTCLQRHASSRYHVSGYRLSSTH
jgi:hypothetical protein